MFRRKTRSTHTTAYTGVNQPAPANNQPNSSAVAAALTIGNSLKTTAVKPITQKPTPKSTQSATAPPTKTYGGSLFKRGSRASIGSMQSSQSQQPQQPPHTPHPFRRFSSGSTVTNSSAYSPTKVHDIDDSFTDSYIDNITDESTRVYLKNQQNLKDLKLEHKPAKGAAVPKKTSSTTTTANVTPKMVKKYIPTPNGIKIVEVPQETYDKEVARCNSMRGSGFSRSSSLRNVSKHVKPIPRSSSLSNVTTARKVAPKRSVSAITPPTNLESMTEVVDLEDKLGKSDEMIEQQRKLDLLQKQIDEEKKLAHELEIKKQEYESLKAKRVQEEQSLNKAIEKEISMDNVEESTTIIQHAEEEETNGEVLEHPEQETNGDVLDHSSVVENTEHALIIEKPELSAVDTLSEHDEETQAVHQETPVPPPVVISESADSNNFPSLDPGVNELGIISQYGNFRSNELLAIASQDSKTKEEEAPPTIEMPAPENYLQDEQAPHEPNNDNHVEPRDLIAPPHHDNASSKSSVYSNESPVRKPIKSAMKNSTSSLPSQGLAQVLAQPQTSAPPPAAKPKSIVKPNPAQQAYLSLTTAENTRMNSKLSHSDLNGASAYPQFHNQKSQVPPQKRLSHQSLRNSQPQPTQLSQQSLRKSPPPPAHQIRTLRPNSMPMEPQGMASRQFRHTPVSNAGHTIVQPIPPHPTTAPGYTSPSKARAQELYAKAQARPKSVFKPTAQEATKTQNKEKAISNRNTRMTLRDPMAPSATQSHGSKPLDSSVDTTPTSDSGNRRRKFKSRFVDSDDEDGPVRHAGNFFSSRFNDSDDEHLQPPVTVLQDVRDVEVAPAAAAAAKEKKKFGKLRKLFGTKRGS
ncbi:uncharacterized protein SPAPADRAFT_48691 [Spathaspora passalidarum NRRL Y-27907]|uniref:Uncharacterized protein n=1 Tax=Spathaspora passalidarum (strain NRRL Y-27907 / 11-Y1) TaxID=619300 RepID=G3AED5_SPAPN|nr:uncharacterized protein SPAPADRAFT_48691 [Spathaspora passalidarum NRRL Y-27907]EGW35723.1 hypothetical protein SPAPADRAFT_48691 [Spathaspora passalidarum NRRL Y-27907]